MKKTPDITRVIVATDVDATSFVTVVDG